MNSRSLILTILVSSAGFPTHSVAQATWTRLGESPSYINEQSVERQKNGNFRVWQKDWLLPEVREKLQADLARVGVRTDFSQYEYSLVLWEYDCLRKRLGPVAGTDYSTSGAVINSYELEAATMTTAVPDSAGYLALIGVCSNKRLRSQR